MRLDYPSASRLLALHQPNHQSRLEHDWMISGDASDQISLHTQCKIGRSRASHLQALLAEGMDRAQALPSLCQGYFVAESRADDVLSTLTHRVSGLDPNNDHNYFLQ